MLGGHLNQAGRGDEAQGHSVSCLMAQNTTGVRGHRTPDGEGATAKLSVQEPIQNEIRLGPHQVADARGVHGLS